MPLPRPPFHGHSLRALASAAAALALLAACDGGARGLLAPGGADRNSVVDWQMARRYGLPFGAALGAGGARFSVSAGAGDEQFGFEEIGCAWCAVGPATPYQGIFFEPVALPGGYVGGGFVDPYSGAASGKSVYNAYGMDSLALVLPSPRAFRGVWVANYRDAREFWIEGYLGRDRVGTSRRVALTSAFQYLESGFDAPVDRLVLRRVDAGADWYGVRFTSGWYRVDNFGFGPPAPPTPLLPGPPADLTAPEITARVTGVEGENGWYTSDVEIAWRVADEESALREVSGCEAAGVTRDTRGVTFTCTATSAGGSATRSVTIRRDATPPQVRGEVEGTRGGAGWYTSDVRVSWSGSDDVSALTSGECPAAAVTDDTAGATFSCTAVNEAGLRATESVTLKRDATAPLLRFAGNAGSYTVDQAVAIQCTASDALSGLGAASCPDVAAPAHTFAPGTHRLGASAADRAGNTADAAATFTVTVTAGALCELTRRWVSRAGVAHSLCVKLAAAGDGGPGALGAYAHELTAQAGKTISAEHAAILIRLAAAM